jgi:hypothetical protein
MIRDSKAMHGRRRPTRRHLAPSFYDAVVSHSKRFLLELPKVASCTRGSFKGRGGEDERASRVGIRAGGGTLRALSVKDGPAAAIPKF